MLFRFFNKYYIYVIGIKGNFGAILLLEITYKLKYIRIWLEQLISAN